MNPELKSDLEDLHAQLAVIRRKLRETTEVVDKQLSFLLKALNEKGDLAHLNHLTRQFMRTTFELGKEIDVYKKRFVVVKKDQPANDPPEPKEPA